MQVVHLVPSTFDLQEHTPLELQDVEVDPEQVCQQILDFAIRLDLRYYDKYKVFLLKKFFSSAAAHLSPGQKALRAIIKSEN